MIIYIFQHDRRKRKKIKIQQVIVVGHRKLELASDRLIRRQRGYMAKSVKEPKQHLNDFIYIRCKFYELDLNTLVRFVIPVYSNCINKIPLLGINLQE